MIILHPLDSLIFDLFPDTGGDKSKLIDAAKRYYTVGPFEPAVSVHDGHLVIEVDDATIKQQHGRYEKLIQLCDRGQFGQAKKDVSALLKETPQNSEYHRILGQILFEEGELEAATDALIDALRWNPKNEYALLMMGNIFARKQDLDAALRYYNAVLELKPDDYLTLNNIGANLMQHGRNTEAKVYFEQAAAINSEYPNTQYALAYLTEQAGDDQTAFARSLDALKYNLKRDTLYSNSFRLAIASAQQLVKASNGKAVVDEYATQLYGKYGTEIKIIEDTTIATAAKIEFAQNYQRDYHLIKYKPHYPAVEHLMMHELVHLELAEEARAAGVNQLYTSGQEHRNSFFFAMDKEAARLRKLGVPSDSITTYLTALFDGINRQNFNTPIDLFIEDILFNRYPNFRSFQFLSVLALMQEGIEATTKPEIVKNTNPDILSKSKILNLVSALHFKDLFGLDLVPDFKPSKAELQQAQTLFDEFRDYREDKGPGEEYELVQHWGHDLKLNKYFDLVPEAGYQPKTIETVMEEMLTDPFRLNSPDPAEEREMEKFIKSHSTEEVNMAVCMYMVGAIEYFKGKPKEEVKNTAFEIAMLGQGGIDPKKDNYSVPSLKGKSFSGYQMIAYFYVSWAIAIPEMLKELRLPFDEEYRLAGQLAKQ